MSNTEAHVKYSSFSVSHVIAVYFPFNRLKGFVCVRGCLIAISAIKKGLQGVSLRVAVLCFLSSPLGGAAVTDGGTILRLTGWIVHIKTKTILRHWRDAE